MGVGLTEITFAAVGTGTVNALNIFESIAAYCASMGRPVVAGEASEDTAQVPYAVVSPDWEPEPDIGAPLPNMPTSHKVSVQVNSYGRANIDALWLDAALYTLLMEPGTQFPGYNIVWRDADESPVLVPTRYGLILSKHWYRFVYSREGN